MPKLTTHQKLSKLNQITFTPEGYKELERKLEKLKNDRPAAVKELARARELGDLSENGLYTAAKARLNSLDNQIFRAEMTLKFANVVASKKSGVISIGSTVLVKDGDQEVLYKIVGDTETNPAEHKVSQKSPIGSALLGKLEGETIAVSIPSGNKNLKILEIT